MEQHNKSPSTWVPPLTYGRNAGETRDWKKKLLRAAYLNVPGDNTLTLEVLTHALATPQPSKYKPKMPTLREENEQFTKQMAQEQFQVEFKDYHNKITNLLPIAEVKAFNIIMAAILPNSTSENVLENNSDYIENRDGTSKEKGYMSAARVMIAIDETHIYKRHGTSDDQDREIERRRMEAEIDLLNIKFPDKMSPDEFNQTFRKAVQRRKEEGLPDIIQEKLILIYLGAAKGNKLYRGLIKSLEHGPRKYPASTHEIYLEMTRHEISDAEIPQGFKAQEGSVRNGYVLLTDLTPSSGVPYKDRVKTDDTNDDANTKIGLQKNGATRVSHETWVKMTKEEKQALAESNKKAIRAMKEKRQQQDGAKDNDAKKKVLLASTGRTSSSSEYSDEEDDGGDSYVFDIDSQYSMRGTKYGVNLTLNQEKSAANSYDDEEHESSIMQREMKDFESQVSKSGHCRKQSDEQQTQRELDYRQRELQLESDIRQMRLDQERSSLDNYKRELDEHVRRETKAAVDAYILQATKQELTQQQSTSVTSGWWPKFAGGWRWGTSSPEKRPTADGKSHLLNNWLFVSIALVLTAVLVTTFMPTGDQQHFSGTHAPTPSPGSTIVATAHYQNAIFKNSMKRRSWVMSTVLVAGPQRSKSSRGKLISFNPFSEKNICFDTGSEVHVAKSTTYAIDIRPCDPGIIGGINAEDKNALKFHQRCSIAHPQLKDAVLCLGASANIISPALARDQGFHKQYLDEEDVYKLTHESGGETMTFGRVTLGRNGQKSNLYIMDMTTYTTPITAFDLFRPIPYIHLTVAQNKAKYTKKEVSNAEKALRFLDCIGQPPLRKAIEILRATKNAPVSEKDLVRADDIWGPRISYLKGVTTKHTTAPARTDTVPAPLVPVDVTMEVDIFFVKKQPFLIGILLPLDYCMVKPLGKVGGRVASAIAKGLIEMVDKAKSRNFVVGSISSDNEGGIAKQATAQQLHEYGIELSFCGAGQHCPHIERRVQFVKGKFRKHEHRLEYAMNIVLVEWGVIVSVRETNMPRSSSSMSALSPREKFLGRPYDFKLDGRFPFGTYAQTTVRDTDNTAAARTEGCIILCPKDNLTGTMWALNIHTQSIVTRDHFYEVPLSDALIAHMNDLAAEDGLSRGSDAFHESEYGVQEDDNPTTTMSIPDDAPMIPATVRFQAYNHDTTPSLATNNAETAVVLPRETLSPQLRDTTKVPAVENRGASDLGYDNRVTVVDVEEGDDDYANDYKVSTPPLTTTTGSTTRPLDTLNIPIEQAQTHTRTEAPTTATRRGIQLRGTSRGDKQTNSLASLQTNILFGQKKSQKSKLNYVEVGENFQDSDFERRFNAQLVHTQNWRDRSFALVVSWQRAIKTHGEVAARSIRDELQQMIDKKVWHPLSFKDMTKQQRLSAIRAKMFVTEKFFPNGLFDKIKSRLVARGDMQDRSLYGENDTSAPTAELSSVLSVAAIAACESRYVATCDIGGAFLNADMFKGSGRKVIVKLDKHVTQMLTKLKPDYESFVGDDGYLFVELDKAMYGCIESAKLWFDHLRNILINDMGFSQNVFDQCTFNKTDAAGYQVTIIMHVDDMLITCANKFTLDWVLDTLALKFPETKCHYGPCVPFLGMDMDFTVPGHVRITMQGAETDILATAGPIGNRETKSPALENLFEVNANSELVSESDQDWFRSNVAKLLYLGKRARPEILTATSFLATRAAKADQDDLGKLRRVLRYIRDSPNRGIRLSPGAHGIHVRAYVDAAYGVHMDGKSHTGVSIVLGESGPIFVRSTKQPIVAKSSTESELIATSDSANQVFHVRNFIIAQGHGDQPATIFQDNLSCMALLAKGKSTSMRTKHIQIRYFWVKERVDNGEAVITHMCSEAMGPANALTKPLVGSQFVEERQQLTNWD